MTEKAFWQQIKRALPYVHWQRIETGTGQGVPDVNGCIGGKWFEVEIHQFNEVQLQMIYLIRLASISLSCVSHKDLP